MNTSSLSPKLVWGLMICLLVVRLYHFNGPIVDRHSWNQISAASMAKYIYEDWKYLFYPTVDVYISPENPSRTYAQEFPLYHIPVVLLYHLTGVTEWSARLVSITFGMTGLYYWYLLSRRLFGAQIAWITLLLSGLSSLNWFYHRAIMSDTSMVTSMIAGCYYFYLWLDDHQSRHFYLALLWTTAAGIFKPFGLVVGVVYLLLILLRKEYHLFQKLPLYLFAIFAWLPTILWILHAMNLENGISEFTDWNSMNQVRHPELLLTWDFYYQLIFVRIFDAILTPWTVLFCIIGYASTRKSDPRYHLPLAWMGACLVYLVTVQHGNYHHEYYQLPFIPGLTLYTAIGVDRFWHWNQLKPRYKSWCLGILGLLFVLHSAVYAIRYFRYDIGSYETGRKIYELSQNKDDRVIAFDLGSNKWNQMIYYSGRTGWFQRPPLALEDIEVYRKYGASWLGVNILFDPHLKQYGPLLKELERHYAKVWENPNSLDRYKRRVLSQVYDLRIALP